VKDIKQKAFILSKSLFSIVNKNEGIKSFYWALVDDCSQSIENNRIKRWLLKNRGLCFCYSSGWGVEARLSTLLPKMWLVFVEK